MLWQTLATSDLRCILLLKTSNTAPRLENDHMQGNRIKFNFDEKKATQAAACLIARAGGRMKYMGVLKLLYLADREALKQSERPITGDRYFSLKNGPILSRVKNLMTEEYTPKEYWSQFISAPSNYSIELLKNPGVGELCELEEDILNQVYDDYGQYDRFTLAELTHVICEEWEDPSGHELDAIPILIENILRAVGKSAEQIDEIREELRTEQILNLVVADPSTKG